MKQMEERLQATNIIRIIINWIIIISCILFVGYQTYSCLYKYIEEPQGTKLSIEFSGLHTFPEITVCPHPDFSFNSAFNTTFLNECGIKRYRKSQKHESTLLRIRIIQVTMLRANFGRIN